MRIFVLLSRVPYPLEKGDKLRAFYQIKKLSDHNEIILCALNSVSELDKQKAFIALQPYCRSINFIDLSPFGKVINLIKAAVKGIPFQVGYFYQKKAAKKINELIEIYKPDIIYAQLIRVAPYVMDFPGKKVVDYQDAFSNGIKKRISGSVFPMRTLLKIEYKRTLHYENEIFQYFDLKTIISEQDRKLIQHPRKGEIKIIKNGVDLTHFFPGNHEKQFDIVFTGNMAYPPNVDAAIFLVKEIMPLVWKQKPDAKLLLAGASPVKKIKNLAGKRITVSGWMNDIRNAYLSSHIFIAPMRIGTGLQNKLLEAMALKIPAITTSLANAALGARNGEEILIGNSAEEISGKILLLLNDQKMQYVLAEKGYDFVKTRYNWDVTTNKLKKLMEKLFEK